MIERSGFAPGTFELLPNERKLWEGRSSRAIRFGWIDLPVTLFMLIWAGVPAYSAYKGLEEGRFDVFLLPFLIIGAYMLVGRFCVDLWLRSRALYILTDRRAMILRNEGRWGARSVKLSAISEVKISRRAAGRGTVTFSDGTRVVWISRQPSLAGLVQYEPAFILIDDAERVYQIAQRAVDAA